MSITSNKISQITLNGILYDVNVSYKDEAGQPVLLDSPTSLSTWTNAQEKERLNTLISTAMNHIITQKSKDLTQCQVIQFNKEGVKFDTDASIPLDGRTAIDPIGTIKTIWDQTQQILNKHYSDRLTYVDIPIDTSPKPGLAPAEVEIDLERGIDPLVGGSDEHDEPEEPSVPRDPRLASVMQESVTRDSGDPTATSPATSSKIKQGWGFVTSLFSRGTESPKMKLPATFSLKDIPAIKTARERLEINGDYYEFLTDAIYAHVTSLNTENLQGSFNCFMEALDLEAHENNYTPAECGKLVEQLLRKLKTRVGETRAEVLSGTLRVTAQDMYDGLTNAFTTYQSLGHLNKATPKLTEASFTACLRS